MQALDVDANEHTMALTFGAFLCFFLLFPTITKTALRTRFSYRDWWVYLRQHIFWFDIQQGVWVCDEHVIECLFCKQYRLPCNTFQGLLCQILPFLPSQGDGDPVRLPIEPTRALSFALLRLAHNDLTFHIADTLSIGESIAKKYCNIIVDILATKLRSKYIAVPSGERLHNIIVDFQNVTLLPNVCGAINSQKTNHGAHTGPILLSTSLPLRSLAGHM
ncbi:hypothetical protein L7F22_064445 [Adiantum nelumboides]|nr:hypothetical protein [Adiantum nelumboides]